MDPFGYVILVAILSVILLIYLSIRVGMKRKHFDIPVRLKFNIEFKLVNVFWARVTST